MHPPRPITVEEMYSRRQLSPEAVEAALDRSLQPVSSDSLYDMVGQAGIGPKHTVLDIGARDGRHSLELASRFGCRVIAVEPTADNIRLGKPLVDAHEHGKLVELIRGRIEDIPLTDGCIDLVFSRDMLNHVVEIERALAECSRVLRPGGTMVIYQTFAGPRLEPREAVELYGDLAIVADRMDPEGFEKAAVSSGFKIEARTVIASQWREAWEEDGSRRTSRQLLQAARLLRGREELLSELGEVDYRVELGNALWGVYQMIGKLEPRIYALRMAG